MPRLKEGIYLTLNSFQDEICNWLCDEMTRDEVDVSQVDMAGNTPLHLAAREGRLSTLSTLLHHGARVHLKVSALHAESIDQ